MAIIKYQLVNGTVPSFITDGGYFVFGNDYIGIGSGGGTELTKSQLLSYVITQHNNSTFQKIIESYTAAPREVDMSDSEVTTVVNNWCTERGIS